MNVITIVTWPELSQVIPHRHDKDFHSLGSIHSDEVLILCDDDERFLEQKKEEKIRFDK